jgi:hypothetical protein
MKKPNNKAIAIYLTWGVINLGLWLSSPTTPINGYSHTGTKMMAYFPTKYFYPFTKGEESSFGNGPYVFENFDLQFYDLTEFAFYMIAPILIYYAITLLKTKDEADK